MLKISKVVIIEQNAVPFTTLTIATMWLILHNSFNRFLLILIFFKNTHLTYITHDITFTLIQILEHLFMRAKEREDREAQGAVEWHITAAKH